MLTFPNNPFCRLTPHPNQKKFLELESLEAFFGGAAGGGKALYAKTMIPTPQGWTTIGDLRPGDFVFGMDGKPTEVIAVSGVMVGKKCWRLTFDDGSRIVSDDNHLWLTYDIAELNALTRRDPVWREARRKRRASRISGNKSAIFTASLIERATAGTRQRSSRLRRGQSGRPPRSLRR